MKFRKLFTAILVVAAFSTTASAVVMEHEWTPGDVKQSAGEFSVTARTGDDGLVHFQVTRKLAKPWWVQANLVVRKGKTRIVETHFPGFVLENSTTYDFEISPEYLDDSTFELAERYVDDDKHERNPLPAPDGDDHLFRLKLFAPKAPAQKTASPAK